MQSESQCQNNPNWQLYVHAEHGPSTDRTLNTGSRLEQTTRQRNNQQKKDCPHKTVMWEVGGTMNESVIDCGYQPDHDVLAAIHRRTHVQMEVGFVRRALA